MPWYQILYLGTVWYRKSNSELKSYNSIIEKRRELDYLFYVRREIARALHYRSLIICMKVVCITNCLPLAGMV